jgi:hypothetical protein
LHARAHFVDQFGGHFAEEARGPRQHFGAVHAARFGVGDEQFFAGAGDADVGEAALLFQPAFVVDRTLAGEQAFFHADQEHHRKLQALGRVQCHQLHAVVPRLALVFAGFQRGVREKRGQLAEAGLDIFLRGSKRLATLTSSSRFSTRDSALPRLSFS